MKRFNSKIIDYFCNDLTAKERADLFDEIKNSPELSEDFKNAEKLFSDIREIKEVEVRQDYFNNILPRFRKNLEEKDKKIWKPSFALTLASLSAVLIIFFVFFSDKQIKNVLNLNDAEQANIINELYNDFTLAEAIDMEVKSDSLINNLIINELDLTSVEENIFTSERIIDAFEDINENEAEKIYSEIINKKFF